MTTPGQFELQPPAESPVRLAVEVGRLMEQRDAARGELAVRLDRIEARLAALDGIADIAAQLAVIHAKLNSILAKLDGDAGEIDVPEWVREEFVESP